MENAIKDGNCNESFQKMYHDKGIHPYRTHETVISKIHKMLFEGNKYKYEDIKYENYRVNAPGVVFKFLLNKYLTKRPLFMLDNDEENRHYRNVVRLHRDALDKYRVYNIKDDSDVGKDINSNNDVNNNVENNNTKCNNNTNTKDNNIEEHYIRPTQYNNHITYSMFYDRHPYGYNEHTKYHRNELSEDESMTEVTSLKDLLHTITHFTFNIYINCDIVCDEEYPLEKAAYDIYDINEGYTNIYDRFMHSHWVAGPKCQRLEGLFRNFDFDSQECKERRVPLLYADHVKSCRNLYKNTEGVNLKDRTYYSCENAESMFEGAKRIDKLPKFYKLSNCNNMFRNANFSDINDTIDGKCVENSIVRANNIKHLENFVDGCDDVKQLFMNRTFDKLQNIDVNSIIGNANNVRTLFLSCVFKNSIRLNYTSKFSNSSIDSLMKCCEYKDGVKGRFYFHKCSMFQKAVNGLDEGIDVVCDSIDQMISYHSFVRPQH